MTFQLLPCTLHDFCFISSLKFGLFVILLQRPLLCNFDLVKNPFSVFYIFLKISKQFYIMILNMEYLIKCKYNIYRYKNTYNQKITGGYILYKIYIHLPYMYNIQKVGNINVYQECLFRFTIFLHIYVYILFYIN